MCGEIKIMENALNAIGTVAHQSDVTDKQVDTLSPIMHALFISCSRQAKDRCGHALTLAGALRKRQCACVPMLFPAHVRRRGYPFVFFSSGD